MSSNRFLVDLYESLIKFRNSFIDLIPEFIFALVVLIFGYVIARTCRYLVKKFINNLPRIFNSETIKSRLYEGNLSQSATHISNIIFWIIIVLTIFMITEIMGVPLITSWFGGIVSYLPNILIATVIVFFGLVGGKLAGNIVVSAINKANLDYGGVAGKAAQYVVVFISLMIATDQLGVEISFLVQLIDIIVAALLFGGGLAFGLGAKNSVSNILASYYVQNNYREGDNVKIDEVSGQIIQIKSTSVIMKTKEGIVNIPAKDFSTKKSTLLKQEQQ